MFKIFNGVVSPTQLLLALTGYEFCDHPRTIKEVQDRLRYYHINRGDFIPMNKIINLTDEDFDEHNLKKDGIAVLVEFSTAKDYTVYEYKFVFISKTEANKLKKGE